MNNESLIYLGGSSVGGNDGPGPSSTVLQIGDRALMVDCGIELLKERQYGFPDFSALALRGITVSTLVLTHAHLDHVGSVGIASEKGVFKNEGKIYGSPQTNAWLPRILDETWGRGVGNDYYRSINVVSDMLTMIPYGEFEIMPGVPAFAGAAGHVPGALYLLLKLPSGKIVLFCGDNSWHDQEIVAGSQLPDDLPNRWLPDIIAVTDLTNPGLTKFDYELEMQRLENHAIDSLVNHRRKIFFATFALGRGQNVVLRMAKTLARLKVETGIRVPLYLDGSSVDIMRIFKEKRWSPADHEFSFEGIELISGEGRQKGEMRRDILESDEPAVVVTPAGFGDGGPIRYYLERGAGDANFEFIATSWLLPGCTMDKLLEKVQRREATGRKMLLKLEDDRNNTVKTINIECHAQHFRLSAHGGLGETRDMVRKIVERRGGKKLEMIGLSHGSWESKQTAARVLGEYSESVIPVFPGACYKL